MEKWIAILTEAAAIVGLLILSAVFFHGKGAFLIAGYNTAGPEARSKYDEKALCRFMGVLMLVLAGCMAVIVLSNLLENMALTWIGIALFFTSVLAGVIYANTGSRFRRK